MINQREYNDDIPQGLMFNSYKPVNRQIKERTADPGADTVSFYIFDSGVINFHFR
jgi:hypothetical protein